MADILTPEGLVKDFTSDPAPMNTVERLLDNMSGGKNIATPTNNLEKIIAEKITGQEATIPTNGLEEELKKVKPGGKSLPRKAINFLSIQGLTKIAFEKAEFLTLTEMPDLPEEPGFVGRGWDWTLDDAKNYLSTHDNLDIAPTYQAEDGSAVITVTTDDSVVSTKSTLFIRCSTEPGATVTAICDGHSYTGVANSNGNLLLPVDAAGTYTVSATLDGETSTTATAVVTNTIDVKLLFLKIVPWSTGTDAEIALMVDALDNGTLTIAETGWQIGDERPVPLSAMEATGGLESHAAQTATLVLMDSQHYDFVTPTAGGDTKDHFVVGLKNCLDEGGKINSSSSSGSWDGCVRRTWCNGTFRDSFPEDIRRCFKQFQCITAEDYNASTTKVSNDYFALFAECEIFSSGQYSRPAEAAAVSRIAYFPLMGVQKARNSSETFINWWSRSPADNNRFCGVYSNGTKDHFYVYNGYGLAPFGCI